MTKQQFWQGMGIGVLAGTALGMQIKGREKTMKRSVNKAVRNMEGMIDSMGK